MAVDTAIQWVGRRIVLTLLTDHIVETRATQTYIIEAQLRSIVMSPGTQSFHFCFSCKEKVTQHSLDPVVRYSSDTESSIWQKINIGPSLRGTYDVHCIARATVHTQK